MRKNVPIQIKPSSPINCATLQKTSRGIGGQKIYNTHGRTRRRRMANKENAVQDRWQVRECCGAGNKRAKQKIAVGRAKIFVRGLQISRKKSSAVLFAVWKRSSEIGHILKDWSTSILVPLRKSGEKHNLKKYRRGALQTHACKAFEGLIADRIKNKHKYNEKQLELQKMMGIETTFMNDMAGCQWVRSTAVLYLRSAYNMVPKGNG